MRRTLSGTFVFAAVLLTSIPTPALAGWRSEGPFLGNVASVVFAPSKPETIYAATSGGGVFRSDDGGASWSLPGDGMTNRNVRWLVVDPVDPASVWAGTNGTGNGSALWRTSDRGVTWKNVSDAYPGGRVQSTGRPVAMAPTQPKTIYVPSSNLHYRTDDGGKTWRDFRVPNQDAYVIAVSPTDPKIVYAGGRGDAQNVSRSADGGKTWRQIGIGLGQNSLSVLLIDPANPKTLYAAGGTFTNIFKSTDEGENWEALTIPVGGTSELFSLTMEPSPPHGLWAATEDGLFRSGDGGSSWTRLDRDTGNYVVQTVAVDPRDAKHLIAGSAGDGIFASRDGGASWSASNKGLAAGWTEKLWGAAGSPALFADMSYGLVRREGNDWVEVAESFGRGKLSNSGGFLFDTGSPGLIYAFDGSTYWKSADGGRRWQSVEQKGPSMRDMMKGSTDSVQFASLAVESGNPKTMYAGSRSNDTPGGAVYKTVDGGKKWTPSGTGLPTEPVRLLLAAAPQTVYARVGAKALFRTTNGGSSWVAASSGLPDGEFHDLVLSRTLPSLLFAATDKGLFKSADSATSWTRVGATSGLEDDDVAAVALDPASGALFAGTFQGVFRSSDNGATWKPMNEALPNTDVRALAVSGSPARLWAGTAGGSIYSTEIP
ncbi:MAG: hypothetical protein ABI639_14095 [Thermoanaerobaculia bacterium]